MSDFELGSDSQSRFHVAAWSGDEHALLEAWDLLLVNDYRPSYESRTEPAGFEGGPGTALNELGAQEGANEEDDNAVCVGKTPLKLAAMGGHAQVASLLLSMGADAAVQDSDGKTALEHASTDAVRDILSATRPVAEQLALNAQLLQAACAGNTSAVETVLAHGGVFTAPMVAQHHARGFFPVHYAVGRFDTRMMNALLAAGADIEQTTLWEGATPLMLAAREDEPDFVELLLDKGANIEAVNASFEHLQPEPRRSQGDYRVNSMETTPLGHAVEQGAIHAVMLLLERGANQESLLERVQALRKVYADRLANPGPQFPFASRYVYKRAPLPSVSDAALRCMESMLRLYANDDAGGAAAAAASAAQLAALTRRAEAAEAEQRRLGARVAELEREARGAALGKRSAETRAAALRDVVGVKRERLESATAAAATATAAAATATWALSSRRELLRDAYACG
jgi:ankyrin repeat protein